MAFKDISIPEAPEPTRLRRASLRKKIATLIPRKVNEKAMEKLSVNDTVRVKLDNILRRGEILKVNPTTAIVNIPDTGEVWKISGYYLIKLTGRSEL